MAQDAPMEFDEFWWMFFVRGEGREGYTDEQLQEMQAGHLANMERMWKEGKAIVAGPFGTEGPRRGIAIRLQSARPLGSEIA